MKAQVQIYGTSVELRGLQLSNGQETLLEAQERMLTMALQGSDCPCCGRNMRIYKRKIYRPVAEAMLEAYSKCRTEWFHKPSVVRGETSANKGGDFLKLRYWGFIKRYEARRDDGSKRNGFWCITPAGADFITGKIDAPKYVYEFDGECVAFSTERTTFAECYGEGFVYREIQV